MVALGGAERKTSLRNIVISLSGVDIKGDFKENFSTRLAFQKTMYLLQMAGVIREKHSFNYYAHGPYSPEWAKIGYEVANGGEKMITLTGDEGVVGGLMRMKPSDGGWLVALATLHYYAVALHLSKEEARERAEVDGKFAVLKHFEEAWQSLESVKFFRVS